MHDENDQCRKIDNQIIHELLKIIRMGEMPKNNDLTNSIKKRYQIIDILNQLDVGGKYSHYGRFQTAGVGQRSSRGLGHCCPRRR